MHSWIDAKEYIIIFIALNFIYHEKFSYTVNIKTHDSESRGQEEAGRTR